MTSRSESRSAGQHLAEPVVEALEVARVPGDVVAMAVQGVEVDEVQEDQTRTSPNG